MTLYTFDRSVKCLVLRSCCGTVVLCLCDSSSVMTSDARKPDASLEREQILVGGTTIKEVIAQVGDESINW